MLYAWKENKINTTDFFVLNKFDQPLHMSFVVINQGEWQSETDRQRQQKNVNKGNFKRKIL